MTIHIPCWEESRGRIIGACLSISIIVTNTDQRIDEDASKNWIFLWNIWRSNAVLGEERDLGWNLFLKIHSVIPDPMTLCRIFYPQPATFTARWWWLSLTPGLAVKVDGCEHSKCQPSTDNFESAVLSNLGDHYYYTTTTTFLSAPPFILLLFLLYTDFSL